MPDDIEGIRTFLSEHVESFELLVLLLALQTDPATPVTSESAGRRTGVAPEDATQLLLALVRHGFCVTVQADTGPAYRYAPRTEILAKDAAALADAYRTSPGTIARLMSEVAIERMQSITARAFADAFVIRKKSDG